MKTIKEIPNAIYHLLTFKHYTVFDRWFEISLGIMAWIYIGIILYSVIK